MAVEGNRRDQGRRATGNYLGATFLLGMLVTLLERRYGLHHRAWLEALAHPFIGASLAFALVLFASARWSALGWVQPGTFAAGTVLSTLTSSGSGDTFYCLGFFAGAILLLFRQGFFSVRRLPKLLACLGLFLGLLVAGALIHRRPLIYTLEPLFFVTAFLLLLYFAYEEKLMVYVVEPKPRYSLSARGFTPLETEYLLAILSGKSSKELAFQFSVSESTARNNLSRCFHKLGLEDRHAFTVFAMEHDIVA